LSVSKDDPGESMKTVILAGGLGTRISEESHLRPKPMIEIGGKPIIWHIMKIYSHYGINDFVICLGYKGYVIKEYFANYFLHMSDVTFDMAENRMHIHNRHAEPWRVTLVTRARARPRVAASSAYAITWAMKPSASPTAMALPISTFRSCSTSTAATASWLR